MTARYRVVSIASGEVLAEAESLQWAKIYQAECETTLKTGSEHLPDEELTHIVSTTSATAQLYLTP